MGEIGSEWLTLTRGGGDVGGDVTDGKDCGDGSDGDGVGGAH